MIKGKTISTIIPVYNEEKTIESILLTLISIDYIDEIIVINDGSNDHTIDVLNKFSKYENVKIINHNQNMGKGYALYNGIINTKGEILIFLDADLIGLTKFHILKLVNPLIYDEADMVMGYAPKNKELINLLNPFKFLTGERVLYKKDLFPIINIIKDSGYGVETIINRSYKNKKVKLINLEGLIHPIKTQKVSNKKLCFIQFSKEAKEIFLTNVKLSIIKTLKNSKMNIGLKR